MCGCGPGQWECHPVACAELQWKVLSLKVRSRARALSRTLRAVRAVSRAQFRAHDARGSQPYSQCGLVWLSEVRRQRRQGYYKWPTHRHRAEHHASWDTVWKTQGQGEAQGGGQGEQDPHRWGQIWHEGCLGNVSTSHQDLINAIVMAANRVLAGTWQHINTCTAAKSVINMHIWTPCKSLQFALRLSLCTALLVSIIVKREGSILMVDTVTPKTADFLFLAETDCDADTLTAPGQSAPGPGYVGSRIPRFLFFFWKTITGFCLS